MSSKRSHDVPFGQPSPEALQLAADIVCRRYVLPETIQHPEVRSECLRLAYLIQAYGLAIPRQEANTSPKESQVDCLGHAA